MSKDVEAIIPPEYLDHLRRGITECFNDNELASLSMLLGIDYDELPDRGKSAKARELILFLHRRSRLEELIRRLENERPNYIWKVDSSEEGWQIADSKASNFRGSLRAQLRSRGCIASISISLASILLVFFVLVIINIRRGDEVKTVGRMTLEAQSTAPVAQQATLEAQSTALTFQQATLEVELTAFIAQQRIRETLEAKSTPSVAQQATLEAESTSRIVRQATLEAESTALAFQQATLDAELAMWTAIKSTKSAVDVRSAAFSSTQAALGTSAAKSTALGTPKREMGP